VGLLKDKNIFGGELMRVLLLYPEFPDTFWSFKHALRFVRKSASSPPLGLVTIAALLPATWEKRLVDTNVSRLRDRDLGWADLVMVSAMIVQRDSARELIDRCKKAGKTVVAGGPLFLSEHESFAGVDHFILNEGEITLPLFLSDLARGCPQHIYRTDAFADMSMTPIPLWELVDFRKYESLSIQYSRGCPFQCDFCNITAMLGRKPRTKSARQIIAELDKMYALGWRRNVFFVDDNFIANKRQLKEEILPALIAWRKGKAGCNYLTEASINLADDEELMRLMATAGFNSVFVGIETPDEASLAECNKGQNVHRDLVECVQAMQRHGLQVMGGFIVGFDNDTESIFDRQIEFIQKSGVVTAMVGMLQAIPGTPLFARLLSEGRISHEMTGDNADGTTNIIPSMGLEKLKAGYSRLMREIYSPDKFYARVKTCLRTYHPPKVRLRLHTAELYAFIRSIWQLGTIGEERRHYWRLFFWTLFHRPRSLTLAVTFAIYGFHFRTVNALNGIR
jgi:radical SAM superfamily enzyme YgiQ (UPF0313 family)